ncbi:hypothetical protein [Streptomyces uncialis]|uniref:hypothetical protein n=1 Tax=Streptomyces uncialis TaxID=1048205 RepID=UPI00224EDAF5|nr:hypothetical protein [Streptomyces uncialis]MCX4661505.1 hypothetical protein [Streptomyces uncialis]
MPLIVSPGAPPVTPPARVVSPDGWLAAALDPVWAGVTLTLNYTASTPLAGAAQVLRTRIVRQDPGHGLPVPVRSGDAAWTVAGVGAAYDHEAPLGRPVAYTATPIYMDGTTGPASSVAIVVPAPAVGARDDLWIKSLDAPGLSVRAMIVDPQAPTSAGRQDTAVIPGSPYTAVAWDVHGAETRQITVDVPPARVDQVRELLRSGVLLTQVRPGYLWPDAYCVPADITGPTSTGKLGATTGFQFTFTAVPVERPPTEGQPLMVPGWSYDHLPDAFSTYDAVAAAYTTYGTLTTNGIA